ncbi:hypothetical protein [Neobacillus mesonae]|nr:hypothetical protein [Neobacillus mesonae]
MMETAGFFGFLKSIVQKINKFKGWFGKSQVIKKTKKEDLYINWGLGIESPYYLSTKFSIDHQSITINGCQTTHNHSWPIKYSIVKTNKLGTSIQCFDSVLIFGNYSDNEFNHTFTIPNGTDYQLEVFNYYKYHSTGQVKMIKKDNLKVG